MSQWDDVVAIQRSTYVEECNKRIAQLEAENDLLAKKLKVINKRTGRVKHIKTPLEINTERRANCIAEFWTRTPRSNSNSFVFHTVQNRPDDDISDKYKRVVIERRLVRG